MSLAGQKITVNGITLNVFVEGDGPSVLLLHGFPDSAYLWRNQMPALVGAGYRVIAPDLRGFGDSDAPQGKGHYSIETIINDLLELLTFLDIDRVFLVGHDWGAIIGWAFSIRHPERVDRYVALSFGHPRAYHEAGFGQRLRSWYMEVFQIPVLADTVIPLFDWFLLKLITLYHAECGHWRADLARDGRLTAGINWYRANRLGFNFGRDYAAMKTPVLGIWSTGDIYLNEAQMKKSANFIQAPWRYERIQGAGHWIPLDASERLNKLLLNYFEQPLNKL